jgi:hypothetical protein
MVPMALAVFRTHSTRHISLSHSLTPRHGPRTSSLPYCDRWLSGPTRKSADAQFSGAFGHTGHTIRDSVTVLRLKVANSARNVTDAGGYHVRYGPGHRPRVITKAVGDHGGVGTMGRPGPLNTPHHSQIRTSGGSSTAAANGSNQADNWRDALPRQGRCGNDALITGTVVI